MKRILVATDDSADADRAVEYAERTTNDYEVELLNVNVIGGYGLADKVLMVLASTQQICLKEQLTSVSDELLTKTRNHVRTIGVATLESRTGDVAQTVIEIGREKKVVRQENVWVDEGSGRLPSA